MNVTRKSEYAIINLGDSSSDGTHWVWCFERGNNKWYFDSFGLPPPTELNNDLQGDVFYPKEQIQPRQEVFCGHLYLHVSKLQRKTSPRNSKQFLVVI